MNKEKLIDYVLNILMIILFFVLVFVVMVDDKEEIVEKEEEKDSYIEIISEDVYDAQEIDGLRFSTSPVVRNETGGYRLEVKVTNISKDLFRLGGFTLIVYDENNNKVDTLSSFEYKEFVADESMLYMLGCEKDLLKNNYSIKYIPSYVVSEG